MKLFYVSFQKKSIYVWIQQFYLGREQKYLWKRFYNIKKPLKNREYDMNISEGSSNCRKFFTSNGQLF